MVVKKPAKPKWHTVGEALLAYQQSSGLSEEDLQTTLNEYEEDWETICDCKWEDRWLYFLQDARPDGEAGNWAQKSGISLLLRTLENLNPADFNFQDLLNIQGQNFIKRSIKSEEISAIKNHELTRISDTEKIIIPQLRNDYMELFGEYTRKQRECRIVAIYCILMTVVTAISWIF